MFVRTLFLGALLASLLSVDASADSTFSYNGVRLGMPRQEFLDSMASPTFGTFNNPTGISDYFGDEQKAIDSLTGQLEFKGNFYVGCTSHDSVVISCEKYTQANLVFYDETLVAMSFYVFDDVFIESLLKFSAKGTEEKLGKPKVDNRKTWDRDAIEYAERSTYHTYAAWRLKKGKDSIRVDVKFNPNRASKDWYSDLRGRMYQTNFVTFSASLIRPSLMRWFDEIVRPVLDARRKESEGGGIKETTTF